MKRLKFLETKRTPHYSLRKFSVGMVSVLLGVTIFGINFTDHSVKAATIESVENSNSSANSRLQQTSAVGNTTVEQTNTQKTTSAKEKVKQSSASKNATANNPTESATNPQSSPKTQGSADTDIKSSTAKSVATNLVTISGTDRNAAGTVDQNNTNTQKATSVTEKVQQNSASNNATANNSTEAATTSQSAPKMQGSADTDIKSSTARLAAKLALTNLVAFPATNGNAAGTAGQNNTNTQPAKENQSLANEHNLTSSDNYSSNIYKGKDEKYYKIVTISGNDYVYHAADIQASGADFWGYPEQTAEDTKNNISISKEDLGNGKTRWTVKFFHNKGLQNDGSTLHGLCNATFGIALTSDYQIVGYVDMEVISDPNQSFVSHTFKPGSSSAKDITIQNPSPEVKFSFNPKTDVEPNGLIRSLAYNNEYLQGPYYFTTATDAGKKNLWQTYFEDGKEYYNAADRSPYLGSNHDFHFNTFKIANETGVDGAKYKDSIIYDTRGGVKGVFSSDNFTQAMEFKSQGKTGNGNTQFSSYVISFTTQHTDSHEIGLTTGSGNQQFSGISANIYSQQNFGYYNMMSSLYGEQRALNAKGVPLKAEDIVSGWDAKKAANKVVDEALVKKSHEIKANTNLTDEEKSKLANDANSAANDAKDRIQSATTNDGATQAGEDGETAIEAVTVPTDSDVKKTAKAAIDKALDNTKSEINLATNLDQPTKDKLIKAATDAADKAKDAITQATTNKDVATEQTKGTQAIDAVKLTSLTDSQTAAKAAIDKALDNTKSEINL
ncbi:LEA family epithelial adhesin, partial [Lactobacillus gallinarum]|uniref:LEA family epithelial adhesin n=2 Tax=Lactobacillus gallinarum TaxID=52242 RepID=UPI0024B12BB8